MMHCNGRCQMMKKMQQEEKKDQENTERSDNKNESPLSSRSFFAKLNMRLCIEVNNAMIYPSSIGVPIDRTEDIFHPPALS
ncbi:MAG: hypothetical protein JST75_09060 [Bacteroidetes bacterium]|nr:hypothetical protein [Bacteroidota bacterium]